jgi:hypothetical protein
VLAGSAADVAALVADMPTLPAERLTGNREREAQIVRRIR